MEGNRNGITGSASQKFHSRRVQHRWGGGGGRISVWWPLGAAVRHRPADPTGRHTRRGVGRAGPDGAVTAAGIVGTARSCRPLGAAILARLPSDWSAVR